MGILIAEEEKMEFDKTTTFKNLASSFASECQAGMRYQMIAQKALQQGYQTLSDEIKKIAKNETVHATRFFDLLTQNNGNMKSVPVNAGFPFENGTVEEMLAFAIDSETNESERIYPEFASVASSEGFEEIADTFRMTAEVEAHHKKIFEYLKERFESGTLFKNNVPKTYTCSKCGHEITANDAFQVCPLCKASQGFVNIVLPENL